MRTVVQMIIVTLAVACCASANTQERKAGAQSKETSVPRLAADYPTRILPFRLALMATPSCGGWATSFGNSASDAVSAH
jgi:hypothetical protein